MWYNYDCVCDVCRCGMLVCGCDVFTVCTITMKYVSLSRCDVFTVCPIVCYNEVRFSVQVWCSTTRPSWQTSSSTRTWGRRCSSVSESWATPCSSPCSSSSRWCVNLRTRYITLPVSSIYQSLLLNPPNSQPICSVQLSKWKTNLWDLQSKK